MPSVLGGLLGGAAGAATGGPVQGILSGLAGFLGGGGKQQSAAQRAALNRQLGIYNQLMGFANSAPMSSVDETQALAQDRGILGQQFRNQVGGLAAGLNPGVQTGGMGDLLANLNQAQTGQQMALDEQHMMDALARRREALLQAANVNQGVFNMASAPGQTQPNDLGETLGQLAQAHAYGQRLKKNQGNSQPNNQGLTIGDFQNLGYATGPDGTVYDSQGQPIYSPAGSAGQAGLSVGDDPAMTHAMLALHHLLAAHAHMQGKKRRASGKRRKKPSTKGVGDDTMALLQGMMGGASPAGQQGAAAPGNQPGGMNGIANQMRQPASAMLDRLRLQVPSGLVLPY